MVVYSVSSPHSIDPRGLLRSACAETLRSVRGCRPSSDWRAATWARWHWVRVTLGMAAFWTRRTPSGRDLPVPPHEHPHDQSRAQHAGVLDRRQDLRPAGLGELSPRTVLLDPAPARSTPRSHVPGTRSDLPWHPGGVRISGGIPTDLLAAVLAVAIPAVATNARIAASSWLFNIEARWTWCGPSCSDDLQTPAYIGPAYWITAFWVPALPPDALHHLHCSVEALAGPA